MSNSKINTKSYFIKRLRDSGYTVDKLSFEYAEGDNRKWSVVVDNGCATLIITCTKDGTFHFYDGLAFANNYIGILTDSIEVLITYLNDWGITNKHVTYHSRNTSKNE